MKFFLTILVIHFSYFGVAQIEGAPSIEEALENYNFNQNQIFNGNDTITYFIKNYTNKPQNLVVFIQGTDPNPLFSYKKKDKSYTYSRWFGNEFKMIDSTFTYAIIPKPGMEELYDDSNIVVPKKYYENNYLDYRVNQIDQSINHIIKNHLDNPDKIVVYGHSEGATIGAALATKNKDITHLGFWSGNVLNNFYEFSLFNRIESLQGKLSDEEAHQNIMGILEWYKGVIAGPNNTDLDHFGYTNKRWSSYEKAPIDYLLEIDIPVYALFATEDQSTPIETAYLIPIKFMENRKDNLTFEVCMGCDHSYQLETEDGRKSLWYDEFEKLMEWVKKVN